MVRIYSAPGLLLLGGAICLGLSLWQWQRGQSKAGIEERLADFSAPADWRAFDGDGQAYYRRFVLSGHYLPGVQFPITHRAYRNRPGYEILTPFRVAESGQTVMVNRGWVSAEALDREVGVPLSGPAVSPSPEQNLSPPAHLALAPGWDDFSRPARIEGIAVPYPRGFRLGGNDPRPVSVDARLLFPLLYPDRGDIELALGADIAPAVFMLDRDQPGVLRHIYRPVAMTAAKHWAYAAQWLLFAVLQWGIAVVYLWRHLRPSPVAS